MSMVPQQVLDNLQKSWADSVEALQNRIIRLSGALGWILEHKDQVSPEAEQVVREALLWKNAPPPKVEK